MKTDEQAKQMTLMPRRKKNDRMSFNLNIRATNCCQDCSESTMRQTNRKTDNHAGLVKLLTATEEDRRTGKLENLETKTD